MEGGEITVRTVVPVVEDGHETFPVFVNIHGGGEHKELRYPSASKADSFSCSPGWSVGSIELDDYFLRKLTVDLKLTTVNVEYRYA